MDLNMSLFSKAPLKIIVTLTLKRLYTELGTSLLWIERTLKSDEWSLIFWAKENKCRAMSELSKKRVRTSLKAIAQLKRACILRSSLSERSNHGTSTPPGPYPVPRVFKKFCDTKFCMFFVLFHALYKSVNNFAKLYNSRSQPEAVPQALQ